jgi:hypothetical protein
MNSIIYNRQHEFADNCYCSSVQVGRREQQMGNYVHVRLLQWTDSQIRTVLLAEVSSAVSASFRLPIRFLRTAKRASQRHLPKYTARVSAARRQVSGPSSFDCAIWETCLVLPRFFRLALPQNLHAARFTLTWTS